MPDPTSPMRAAFSLAAAVALIAVAAPTADAQQIDDRWLPYLGCWEAVHDAADAPMTCVRPGPAGGVELLAVTADGVTETRVLHADGVARTRVAEGCRASESAEFSADGTRIYLHGELACDDAPVRSTAGLMAMVDRDRWIEVQAMDVGGRSAAWAQQFAPAPRGRVAAAGLTGIQELVDQRARAVRMARLAASAPITVDEVIEAHARTDAEAVRIWVAEQVHTIPLDSRALARLAEAGVSEEVIDVVVAVAYPERFAVAEAPPLDRRPRRGVYDPYWGWPRYPGYWDPYYMYYSRGWGGYGLGWSPYRYYPSRVVVVTPRDNRGGMVRGRGPTGGTATAPSSRSTGGASVRSPRPASSQPASGGRSSGGERRAQPRGN